MELFKNYATALAAKAAVAESAQDAALFAQASATLMGASQTLFYVEREAEMSHHQAAKGMTNGAAGSDHTAGINRR